MQMYNVFQENKLLDSLILVKFKWVDKFKDLGVFFDTKLRFNTHMDSITLKTK